MRPTIPPTRERDAQRTLELLLQLTAQLTDDRPLEEFLKAVTDTSIELFPAEHASVRLLDATRTWLLSGARSGVGSHDRPMDFRPDEGVLGWVVQHGEPVRIGQVESDPRWSTKKTQGFAVQSIMAEPLWSSGEVIGVIAMTSSKLNVFTEEEQVMLRLLANCSAPPIERARLRRLAMFDDLTLAFNHRYLVPRVVEEMARATRSGGGLSMAYMDLDHFKSVNDRFGHAVGDVVLKMFAERVRRAVRRIDVLVRRGGEEFVLIMPATGAAEALVTANRILSTLGSEAIDIGEDRHLHQTVSIGVATWDHDESPEQLERRADEAMYEAKRCGRNRVVVAPAPVKEPR